MYNQYVVVEKEEKVAVQIDVETIEKIENSFENFGMVQKMKDSDLEGRRISILLETWLRGEEITGVD